ncbi:hypothetical protein [Streptomyces sp. NPDC048106]|uniref:hypothetical protein n=1 Tax=Streptomyces sp. NPDC048106 TaxID=3155750 RepID=UPI0034571EE7
MGTRLDQAPGDVGGGGPDLAHAPGDKKGAADALRKDIEPDTASAGRWADDETGAVIKAFDAKDGHGWLTSAAVRKAHTTWGEQVQGLVNRLMLDESALRGTGNLLTGTDIDVGTGVRKTSILDTYSSD